MSFTGFFGRLVESLEETGIPYMLTGSLAASYYGPPRSTQDIDLVVEVLGSQLAPLCARFTALGYYVSEEAAFEAIKTPGQFNVIDPDSGWKADFIVRKSRPFSEAEFKRRRQIEISGRMVWIVSAEDLVIAKLEWSTFGESERQLRDVQGILRLQGAQLDSIYIADWVAKLGLAEPWTTVQDHRS